MKWLTIAQVITSVLLIVSILLQQRGSSLGAAFGGESTVFRTKRGIEKKLFIATIVLGCIFVGLAIVGLFL